MTYLGIVIGIIILAVIVFLAIDKKSNFTLRIASLAAIFLMILTVIICLILVITDNRVPVDESVLIVGAVQEVKKTSHASIMTLLLMILFLIGMFIFLVFFSLREQRKNFPKAGEVKK